MDDKTDDRDPLEGLEERLESHSKAFESLLALTPAQEYYGKQVLDGQDPSEQWNRKKQSKEQKRAAKKAKLDPANQKSALDVMKEREAEAVKGKRKREGGEDDVVEEKGASKQQKGEVDGDAAEARRRERAEKRKEKRMRKKEKKARQETRKARKQERARAEAEEEKQQREGLDDAVDDNIDGVPEPVEGGADMEEMDFTGLGNDIDALEERQDIDDAASQGSSAPTTPLLDSPAFDMATNHSESSSSSSITPPANEIPPIRPSPPKQPETTLTVDTQPAESTSTQATAEAPSGTSSPKLHLPKINHEELENRVRKRIEELRAARKADGPDGKLAKSRQELLDQRRKKGEQKKAAKKEQRQKAKEEEQHRRDEQLRGSGSPLSADIFSPRSPAARDNNFSFSRLAFDDGTSADPGLTSLQDLKRKKGPQDPKTALQAAQSKQARISGYDAGKKADIADKDMWLNAKKRAHGERVRDDTSLLKKALKRKEKQKGKSEQEWKERGEAVVKGREVKQKKREGNLAKRREEKGGGGGGKKKSGGKGGAGGKKKPKGKAGFGGAGFRSKA